MKLSPEEGEGYWKFVQGAYKEWDYVNITELMQKLSEEEVQKLRELALNPEQKSLEADK